MWPAIIRSSWTTPMWSIEWRGRKPSITGRTWTTRTGLWGLTPSLAPVLRDHWTRCLCTTRCVSTSQRSLTRKTRGWRSTGTSCWRRSSPWRPPGCWPGPCQSPTSPTSGGSVGAVTGRRGRPRTETTKWDTRTRSSALAPVQDPRQCWCVPARQARATQNWLLLQVIDDLTFHRLYL